MTKRLVLVIGLLLLAGCGSPVVGSAPGQSAEVVVPALPVSISVPAIGAESSLVALGRKSDGTLEVPSVDQPQQASWYELSPVPGMVGPAVVLGHIDGRGRPGVFHKLAALKAGDVAVVVDGDGVRREFVVYRVEQVSKQQFPAERVFGDTEGAELRLITCGGVFVGGDLGYQDNTVAYLKLAV